MTAECYIECMLSGNTLSTNVLKRSLCVLYLRNSSTVFILFIKTYVTLGSDMHIKYIRLDSFAKKK